MYSLWELGFYLLFYAFIGWFMETVYMAVRRRGWINHGFLNLPFTLPYGIASVIILAVLPTMPRNLALQYIVAVIIFGIVWSISEQIVKNIGHDTVFEHQHRKLFYDMVGHWFTLIAAMIGFVGYLMVHPLIHSMVILLPQIVIKITVIVGFVLVVGDFLSVIYTLKTNRKLKSSQKKINGTLQLADKITGAIWNRLEKAYPGVQQIGDAVKERYVFARGICLDKMLWVLLISACLGALIETGYCYTQGAGWMNRSSLLYGQFSMVWGVGAVVLTVALERLLNRPMWMIFLAGFFIGGTYEYTCSVLSELVFGTVFWDYSDMPLNIGGRTNVLYCVYWGILAVVWMKVLYPPMEIVIEKIPPLPGKVITWAVVFVMLCNCILTGGAMIRYTERQVDREPDTVIETFLDNRYDDAYMEERWPNMKIV